MKLNAAIFTFNMQAQVYCIEQTKSPNNLTKHFSDCIPSNFVSEFINIVTNANHNILPEIFIINLQESSIGNPLKWFRSDKLIYAFYEHIKSIDSNYIIVKKKLEGVGNVGIRGLRTVLIINKNINARYNFKCYRPLFSGDISINKGQSYGKGAILLELYINSDNKQTDLQFINTHLPFIDSDIDQGKIYRDQTLMETLSYFNIKNSLSKKFIIGDLNYRVDFGDNVELSNHYLQIFKNKDYQSLNLSDYRKFDQLNSTLHNILPDFQEGVNNNGPDFLPTCKLEKKLSDNNIRDYQLSKKGTNRMPSWCDRILYSKGVNCLLYCNFDYGNTYKSDHIPVIGLFQL